MQKSSALLLSLIALAAIGLFYLPASENHTEQEIQYFKVNFESFKTKFDKRYQPTLQKYRFQIFIQNLKHINQHNSNKSSSYKMGVNQFADMTHQEFVQKMLNQDLHKMQKDFIYNDVEYPGVPPTSVDWRGKGVINPVRDQGECGSSWTFSATGTMQSVLAVKNKTLIEYSKQQLLDCCTYPKYGCQGCKGAFPDWAMSYVKDFGIVLDSQYPFTTWADTCKPIPTAKKVLNHTKPFTIIVNNTNNMKNALATEGPLSVSVDAYRWQFYASGVYNDCHDDHITLATLLVGYQTDDVWIMRNSWGTTWGQQGYIRISPKSTACLIRTHVVIPNFGA